MISNDERPIDSGREILDLGILRRPIDRPIHIENGKHRIEIEMVNTAVEIKYPRTDTAMPSTERGSIKSFSDKEIKNIVSLQRLGFDADIEELESLEEDYISDTFFIIIFQYDILRRDSYTNNRHQRLADATVELIRERCDRTSVLYGNPEGWEWIVMN
jgi:hypothetical protein